MGINHRIIEIFSKEENDFVREDSNYLKKTLALYSFYHYYNADLT